MTYEIWKKNQKGLIKWSDLVYEDVIDFLSIAAYQYYGCTEKKLLTVLVRNHITNKVGRMHRINCISDIYMPKKDNCLNKFVQNFYSYFHWDQLSVI